MDFGPTIGDLYLNGEVICSTLELPWANNSKNLSCIPCGSYACLPLKNHVTSKGTKFQECFQVSNVDNRAGILIHPGNQVHETTGCILVGTLHSQNGIKMVLNSRISIGKLWDLVGGRMFILEITCTD